MVTFDDLFNYTIVICTVISVVFIIINTKKNNRPIVGSC